MVFLNVGVGHYGSGAAGHPGRADAWLYVLLPRSSTVEVAAAPPPVGLGPELASQLHEAPDPGAIGGDVRARRWWPPRESLPGRRRAAPRAAPVAAPEPPNREHRQRFLLLLVARLRPGTVGGWVGRSWRHRLDPVDHQHYRRGCPGHDRGLGDRQTRQGSLRVLGSRGPRSSVRTSAGRAASPILTAATRPAQVILVPSACPYAG
jgi:hypothetical protein